MADTEGVTAVTLRSVATRSGLTYKHLQREYGGRDHLVASMVQHLLSSPAPPPAAASDPVETLITLADREWTAYRARPWLVEVMASTRPPLVPAVLDTSGAAIDVLMGIGLDYDTARDRFLAFSAYVQGMGLLLLAEHREAIGSGASLHAWWSMEIQRMDRQGRLRQRRSLGELSEPRSPADFEAP